MVRFKALLTFMVAICAIHAGASLSLAQTEERASKQTSSNASRNGEENLDFQFHLLVASNTSIGAAKLPPPLEAVARQLRSTMQLTNYRLGATFLNRVSNGSKLEVKGVGTAQLTSPTSNASVTPTFYDFFFSPIKLSTDATGREIVQMEIFRFGMRLPVQTSTVPSPSSQGGFPVFQYEPVGITTGVSVPLNEPTVIGTLSVGRPDETLVLVLLAQKISTR